MDWRARVRGDAVSWLCEPDSANPGVRYFALRELLDRPADDPDVLAARAAIMAEGPVPAILAAQQPEGYWQLPGGGYGKYRGTVWQIMLLSELGADPTDARVRRGCDYVLEHSVASNGGFSYNARPSVGSVVHCLNGNLLAALIRLGWLDDARGRNRRWHGRRTPSPARRQRTTCAPAPADRSLPAGSTCSSPVAGARPKR